MSRPVVEYITCQMVLKLKYPSTYISMACSHPLSSGEISQSSAGLPSLVYRLEANLDPPPGRANRNVDVNVGYLATSMTKNAWGPVTGSFSLLMEKPPTLRPSPSMLSHWPKFPEKEV